MGIQRVFVSSVMRDYEDRREAARKAISELGVQPVLAEDLTAGPQPPREDVLEEIERCDAMVGIYGKRYGWPHTESGRSPTEEEYDFAWRHWIRIYAFIDGMESGEPEPRQRSFLQKVQHWDTGVVRNVFSSLRDLEDKIKRSLTHTDRSPRYQAFLVGLSDCAEHEGFMESLQTRLPAFDLLLYKPATRMDMQPHRLIAVLDGDRYGRQEISDIGERWVRVVAEQFQTGFWRGTAASGTILIAVERNSHQLTAGSLREAYSLKKNVRIDAALVDLVELTVEFPPKPGWKRPWAPNIVEALVACARESMKHSRERHSSDD